MNELVLFLLVPTLVPIVPAFILFKFLPSKASVKGAVKNIKINLVGGFGGYFAVLWILLPYANGLRPKPPQSNQFQIYRIIGHVTIDGSTRLPDNQVTFTAVNPPLPVSSISTADGSFTLDIPIGPDLSGNLAFPELQVERNGCQSAVLVLTDPIDAKRDDKSHTITIQNAVNLADAPPYQPTQTAKPL